MQFERYRHSKIWQIRLNMPIHCPKISVFGKFRLLNIIGHCADTKSTSLRETASYEPSRVKIGSVVFAVGDKKERKGKERKGKERKGKERKGKERKGKERKGKEGKERYKKSQSRYISRICREVPL